jgi:hypothetical protein
MERGGVRCAGLIGLLIALLTASPATAATTIGSSLQGTAEGPVCSSSGPMQAEHSCTVAQQGPNPLYTAPGGPVAPFGGIVVRWRIVTGTAPAGTVAIEARLHAVRENTGGAVEGNYTSIPLAEPGLHVFPARLPIAAGERLALDTLITNRASEAAWLPMVHYAPEAGLPDEWTPALLGGETRAPSEFPTSSYDVMLNADIEPDADHDGYGDETQDLCPTNSAIHTACPGQLGPPAPDTRPPKTKLTYPVRQDFIGKKLVLVHLRSDEAASVVASGQLEAPGKHTIWGIRGAKAPVAAGQRVTLRLKVPHSPLKAAKLALAKGRKVHVKVTLFAVDAAGNRSGASVATIKPER